MGPPASPPCKGFFVTGTDTGVGKTLFSAALLHVLNDLGLRAVGMKPVAAGADFLDGVWVNEDVALLRAASGVTASNELVNPYLFRDPIAPHLAAERQGVRIEIPRIVAACEALAEQAGVVVVEGVGGLRVPLGPLNDGADLAGALGLPLILVVGMRLGCLNHALLTVEAIERRGLMLAGWVANRLDPAMAAYEENLASLDHRLPAPRLAELPHLGHPDPRRLARFLPPKRVADLLAIRS